MSNDIFSRVRALEVQFKKLGLEIQTLAKDIGRLQMDSIEQGDQIKTIREHIFDNDIVEADLDNFDTICCCDDWICTCEAEEMPMPKIPTASPEEIYNIHKGLREISMNECEEILSDLISKNKEIKEYKIFSNKKGRKVTTYLYDVDGNVVKKGVSQCHKRDLWSEQIGATIAFYRMADLPVPERYLNIPAVAEF